MNAKEARETALRFNNNSEYKDVVDKIKDASFDGALSLNIYMLLKNDTIRMLKEDGFKIEQGVDGRNDIYCYINW